MLNDQSYLERIAVFVVSSVKISWRIGDSMKKFWVVPIVLSLVLVYGCGDDKTDMGTNSTAVQQPASPSVASTENTNISNAAPVAKFKADFTVGSLATVFTFDGTASTADDGIARFWDFGDETTVAGGKIVTHKFKEVGKYNVRLRVTDAKGNSDYAAKNITVLEDAPPVAAFTVDPPSGAVGAKLRFDASTSVDMDGTIATYRWDFGDNSTGQGKVSTHSYAREGTYTVSLTVKDRKGTEGTVKKQVKVDNSGGQLCTSGADFVSLPQPADADNTECYGFGGIQKFVITGVAWPQIRVDHALHGCHGKPELRRIGVDGIQEFLGDVSAFSCGNTVLTIKVYGIPGYVQPHVGERAYLVYLH